MAIGDPWDSSYNPSYPNLRNQRTGKKSWWPDASDEVPQDDPLSFKDRRGGRFCTEGCGCIDTYCDNLAGAKCQLPPEIAVTIIRTADGRYQARAGIEGGAGETYHLKYSNGAWRGSRCCSQTATDALSYACDPCKVTTLPNGKPSECHYANNKYVTLDSDKQVGDGFQVRDDFDYDKALQGDNWPRRGADAWMVPEVYGVMLPGGGTDMLNSSVRDGERPICWDVNGVPNYGITTEDDCIDINGLWSENDPNIKNNNVEDRAGQRLVDLKGTNLQKTHFSENRADALINIKARERRIFVTPEGYYAHSSYNAIHGSGANKESACFEDGAVPLKKTPWCRHPFDATEVEAFCTNPDKGESSCESSGATWLLDDKEECTLRGLCYSPKDGEPTVRDQLIKPACLKRPTTSNGTPTKFPALNQYDCEVRFHHTHDWHYETQENCVLYSGEEVYAGCYSGAFGDVWEGDVATEEECLEIDERIWKHPNVFIPYDFVDWEYERQSCCGQTLLDEDHPFHTPQISGGAANTRKNTVCITPYSEVILSPSTITGSNAPQTGAEGSCTSVGNQHDRVLFHLDGESYWTLTIRPCNFWGACLEKGVPRPDPYDIKGQQDNYFDTTCGEEVMLFLPVDQFMNCSNFNLTLGKESQLRSGWPESQPLWDPKMGDQMGNPVNELFQKGAGGAAPPLAMKGPIGYFPGDAIEGIQHQHWCAYPDANYDGIADGGKDQCQAYHYYNHNKGEYFGELMNAKGADAFYGFNIQPQPFKATEEKQNRAKGPDQAAAHHKYWQACTAYVLGHMAGGGTWFWNYGPDYFMYYDFIAFDEMTIGTGPIAVKKYDGFCNEVATKAKKYVDEHVGFLRRGDCGYGNGAMWVGWVPFDGWTNNLSCPECEEQTKASCGKTGSCVAADGSFEHATPEDCEASGGEFNICCEWFEGCDRRKLVNFKDVVEKHATPIWEEAKTEAECVKPMDEGGAEGNWNDGCSPAGIALAENQECPQVQPVPEAFVDIVLGKKLGECLLEDGTLIQDYETEEACNGRDGDNTWTGASVGGSDSSYPLRELEGVIKARPSGPSTSGLVDTSSIKKGFSDKVGGGYSRRILGSEGSDTGNSMSYWHDTGLFPKGEMASYVNDHCLGIKQHKRIQYASNEKPIKITSRNHLLKDGDLVHTYNVMGNFAANVMYQQDWQEMQWEDKLYSPCSGPNCENLVWPNSVCPYTSACLDDSQGKCIRLSDDSEVDLKKEDCLGPVYKWDASTDAGSKLECEYGKCSKKREDGTVCDRKTDCEADADICKMQDDNGDCPSGFTVDADKAPGEECGCVKDDADGPPGCGGVWEGGGGTWELSCDSKYYACSGEMINGEIPPPADFFVIKNVTLDTFDLYTCDKYPVDGRIINKANIDTTECVEEVEEGCIMNYRLGMGAAEAPEQVSWITKKLAENKGIPSQEPTQFRCLDTYTGKLSFQNNGKSTHIPTGDTITNSETSGAPVDEEHTCYKTQSDGGKACAEADCDALGICFNTIDETGALDENGNPKSKADCTDFAERWTTSWRNYDTFEDDEKTADNEAEINCALYGTCTVVVGYEYNVNAFMKKEDCDALAQVYAVYDPSVDVDHKNQLYVNRCQDADAKLLNDKDLHSGTTEEQKEACESKGKCYDYDGDVVDGINNKSDCEESGFEFKGATFIEGRYADCVDLNDDDPFKTCWSQAWYGDLGVLDVGSELTSGRGKPSVGVYKTCPFTGEFDYWGHHEDIGVEGGYIGHYEDDEIDSLYRFGFGGPGYKWEERANDYYVQIEQKGICPVCCDHFMPNKLVATVTGQSSEILDYIGCGMDECEAPTADDSQSFNAAKALKNEGYCCYDTFHGCDLSDLPECEDEFRRHIADPNNVDITFGTCTEGSGRVRTFVWRKKGCDGPNDTFTPLTHSGGVSECNMFLRKRPTLFGDTNCRKCSSVYTSRNKTKTVSETGNTQIQYIGVDKDGKKTDCCSDTAYCEALVSDNNTDIIGNCSHPYLPCKEAKSCSGIEEKNCSDANVGEVVQITSALTATCTKVSDAPESAYIWAFDPCSCYPNFVEMKYEPEVVEDIGDGTCHVNGNGDEGYDNDAYTGCGPTVLSTTADETCVDHANSHAPVDETCPGLQSLDVPMEYDGIVWRSEWTLMNTVGTHQCDLGLHRFKWPSACQPTGPNLDFSPYTAFKSGDELVAINADCDACDMPQYGGIAGGVLVDGTSTDLILRNAKPPSLPQDGHFIRLVMGCGNSIPSMAAYNSGDIVDGGFGPTGGDNYRQNGLDIWAEITNCTFTDFMGSEGLRVDNVTSGIQGTPPCDTGGLVGCLPKRLITGDSWRKTGKPSALERRYTFAGRCISKTDCGPRGACVDTECCTYTGVDYPFRTGGGSPPIRAPLWSGGVACSTGGDISHRCQAYGFDPIPNKPAEQFTVRYVKDVDPETGEATLVIPAYPPTFGGRHCAYEKGTPIGIGLAELQQAETDTFGSYSRSNKSRNPYLPAGGTILNTDIPRGDNIPDKDGDAGRGSGQYMEIRVADVSKLITKNPRKNRHLRIYDRTTTQNGNPISATTFEYMNMKQNLELPQPYGLNPWPVDHQTHSSLSRHMSMWPKGVPMGPSNVESLRTDPTGSITQPGRIGPKPTVDNLNRMFRYKEVDTGGGMTTPIPEILPVEPVMINAFENIYSDQDYFCTNNVYKNNSTCVGNGHLWIPHFSHTEVATHYDHDLADAEKVVISGSVVYPATCKGTRMGYCVDDRYGMNVSRMDINECSEGACVDVATNTGITDSNGDPITDKNECDRVGFGGIPNPVTPGGLAEFQTNGEWVQLYEDTGDPESPLGMDGDKFLCERIFGGDWVIGRRNDEKDGYKYKDPLNLKPLEISGGQKTGDAKDFFVEGCPVGCQINGFYLQDPCQPPSKNSPQGQCFECVEIVYEDDSGNEQREMRCPRSPADGSYVVRKRGCQNAKYDNREDCKENGWHWWEPVTAATRFALHDELELVVHDASQLRSNLEANKPTPRFGQASDWEYDLSQKPKTFTKDAGFFGEGDKLAGWAGIGGLGTCTFPAGTVWKNTDGDIVDPPAGIDTKAGCERDFCTLYEIDNQSDCTSNGYDWITGVWDYEIDTCNSIRDAVFSDVFNMCIDLNTLDQQFPFYFPVDNSYVPDDSEESLEIARLCDMSDSCESIRPYKECRDVSDDQAGTCIYLVDGNEVTESVTASECGPTGVFIGPVIQKTKKECGEAGLTLGASIDTQIINEFVCIDSSGNTLNVRTPAECTKIVKGTVKYLGKPVANSADDRKLNLITQKEKFLELSSPEAMLMGHEVGIGLAPRNFKGVIYAPQAENEKFNEYADPHWRAVWSRHGGAFDIIIGYPPPVNNCRQGNSNKPVNMDFYLGFDQICCNERGPLNFHQCEEKCWTHYLGPHLEDMELRYGIHGDSIMHVNIHE